MSTARQDSRSSAREASGGDPRRWRALGVLAAIQFMLVLDITVVTVALPRIQYDLGFSRAGLAWVVNGYGIAPAERTSFTAPAATEASGKKCYYVLDVLLCD